MNFTALLLILMTMMAVAIALLVRQIVAMNQQLKDARAMVFRANEDARVSKQYAIKRTDPSEVERVREKYTRPSNGGDE